MISGAIERNREYSSQYVSVEEDVNKDIIEVLYDPQTSGGLLIAIKENKADELISRLKDKGICNAAIIGKIISKSNGNIILRKSSV
jgi:selenide,water dikinase